MAQSLRNRNPIKKDASKPPKSTPGSTNSTTLLRNEIPAWMQDNVYILSGYRRELGSWAACAYSVFGYLHNETVNIHTHLWGAILFSFLLGSTYSLTLAAHPSVTWHDVAGFVAFLSGAVFCLLCSTTYHVFQCHSPKVADTAHTLDYVGIVVLTVSSFYPELYYGFFCDPAFQITYIAAITVSGMFACYVVLSPTYGKSEYIWARTVVFIALGLTAIVPISHIVYVYGFYYPVQHLGLLWVVASGALYIGGAVLYAARVPERWYPGRFDYFFASHQIFHTCVVLAALCHYVALLIAVRHHHGANMGQCMIGPSVSEDTFMRMHNAEM